MRMRIIIAMLLTVSIFFLSSCESISGKVSSETELFKNEISDIKTIDEIKVVDPSCFQYLSYVFYKQYGDWCVARVADDHKTVVKIKTFKAKEVTVSDMLKIKTDCSMDIYEVVEMLGLPIDSRTSGMVSMVFSADCGAETTIYFSLDNTNPIKPMKASGIVFNLETIDFSGFKYSEVKRIMGSDGKDVGSGTVIMKWDLPDGRVLKVWLTDWGNSYDNGVVSKYIIE